MVFATTTRETWVPYVRGGSKRGYPVGKVMYQFVRVVPERHFGFSKVWIGEAGIQMTDPERTLLDGLAMPQYFGDFAEVLSAFGSYGDKLDQDKIIKYALLLDVAVVKRLGWVLEKMKKGGLDKLSRHPSRAYNRLDPTRPSAGRHNKRWMIQENLPGKSGL